MHFLDTSNQFQSLCRSRCQFIFQKSGTIFQIADQKDKALATHAGHTVLLTGELKGDTIAVSKIDMPKKEVPKAEMPKMDMPMPKK